MAIGVHSNYYFKGSPTVRLGATLEEALRDLIQWWDSFPSLMMHEIGNLHIALTVGGMTAEFEITDANLLEELRIQGPILVVEEVAKMMGIDKDDAMEILDQAAAEITVSSIQDPKDKTLWSPDPGFEPEVVLPASALGFIGEMIKEADADVRRGKGRVKTERSRYLTRMAVRSGEKLQLSDARISLETGIPRSTVRDERMRELRVKPSRARISDDVRRSIVSELSKESNAAKVARKYGISERTVRDLRAKEQVKTKKVETKPKVRNMAKLRSRVVEMVKNHEAIPSEAGRIVGVSPRTARRWIQEERLKEDED